MLPTVSVKLPRLGVVCDFKEENWPSMDLVADMLLGHLQQEYSDVVVATRIQPPMRRRFTRRTAAARGQKPESGRLFNADRLLNRFWDYPQFVRRISNDFDLFHVVDHSYSQLLHELPPERTLITCHDLDTFQCLLDPVHDPRSFLFRKMMSRTLSGFKKAALVGCDSVATRDELLSHRLTDPDRAVVVPNGVHPSCSPEGDPPADREAAQLLGQPVAGAQEILHVGSTIPRKRIDILLQTFAAVRNQFPTVRLIRVGGPFTPEQERLSERLDLTRSIIVLPHLERKVLAAVYRRATVLLQPSEREGFGLPVVEALACGTAVVASDLPVLREVGGRSARYCPVGEVDLWVEAVVRTLAEEAERSSQWRASREARIAGAIKFSWTQYAAGMVGLYRRLLQVAN